MKKYYHIYKITNLINGKIYIGRHYGTIEDSYSGSGFLLNRAYEKYGKENFKKELVEKNISLDENKEREKFWIKEFNSFQPNGYNINVGGDGGDNISHNPRYEEIRNKIAIGIRKRNAEYPEICKKQGEKIKGENNPMFGRNDQSHGLKKRAKWLEGKTYEEIFGEEKAKQIKETMSKNRKGRKLSEETKEKMRLANLGKKNPSYKEVPEEIISLVLNEYEKTKNAGIIAKSTKINLYTVEKILKENNLSYFKKSGSTTSGKNNPRYYELDKDIYEAAKKDYYENFFYMKEIANKYHISIRKFKSQLKEEGLELRKKNQRRKE